MSRAEQRMLWLLRKMTAPLRRGLDSMVAWDEDVVDDFVDAFPEATRTLKVYTMGPNSCPMLNRAAKRAKDAGYLKAGHIGNQDARSFNQRTWCRVWVITPEGRAAAARSLPEKQGAE